MIFPRRANRGEISFNYLRN